MTETGEGNLRLAVPSEGAGGLGARRSSHFGKCACFTMVDIDHSEFTEVRTLSNPARDGGCRKPVELLVSNGVTAVVVGAIGERPLAALATAGINVLFDAGSQSVGEAVEDVRLGITPVMSPQWACAERHSGQCGGRDGRPSG